MHRHLFWLLATRAWLLFATPAHAAVGHAVAAYDNAGLRTVDARHSAAYGPVLQTDLGHAQLSANIFFERDFEPEDGKPIQMKYQWQLRHRWHPLMNFGLQGYGEFGRWSDWTENGRRSHRAGPAFFGRVDLGQGGGPNKALLYQAAYLLGTVYSKRGGMFTVRVQYQF